MTDDLTIGGVIPGAGVCAIPDCGTAIPKRRLMCTPHWTKVPTKARAQVYAELDAWNAGTGSLGSLRDAQAAAVAAVAGPAPHVSVCEDCGAAGYGNFSCSTCRAYHGISVAP